MMPLEESEGAAAHAKGLRNKKCLYCDRKFVKAEHLRRHQRSHTGEKPFQCKHCLKEYARSDVLMRHIRNHHLQVESEQDVKSSSHGAPDDIPASGKVEQNNGQPSPGPVEVMPNPIMASYNHSKLAFKDNPSPLSSGTDVLRSSNVGIDYPNTNDVDIRQSPGDASRSSLMYPVPSMNPPQTTISSYQLLQPARLLGPPAAQSERRSVPETFHSIHPWLDSYAQDFGAGPSSMGMWDELPQVDFVGITPGMYPSPSSARTIQQSPPTDNISDERYAKIASLWPTQKRPAHRLIQSLWREVANFDEDNIFSEPDEGPRAATVFSVNPSRCESRWGFDDDRRSRLISDCRPRSKLPEKSSLEGRLSIDGRSDSGSSSQDTQGYGTKFPSTQLLDISIDLYFRRFQPLMPFIHEPTFSAQKTSSTLLFPLCLFGLTLLDSARAKNFVNAQLPDAIERGRKDLLLSSRREGQLGELLTALASSILLLALAAVCPKHTLAEYNRSLYSETMAIANRHGLFVPQQGEQLSAAIFQSMSGDDPVWKAWSRVESVKRLIVTLIMTDSFYSHLEGHNPLIPTDTLHFYFPCKTELFQATTARRWSQMLTSGAATIMPWLTPRLESTVLPQPSDASDIGFFGLFSAIWVRIGEARYRFTMTNPENAVILIPAEVFAKDVQAATITALVLKVWETYGETIALINPNCEAFWHHLCLSVTADLGIFELAAGRGGADSAKGALDKIITWSQSAAARRACVHAAQTFHIMSKRSVNNGTSFEAEMSLVHSALVLGLYVFVMPQCDLPNPPQEIEAFELLDRVDWNLVGEEGFTKHPLPEVGASCAAKTWIRNGGPISFSGLIHHGGYSSARRVLLDYVYLLEDCGKWNVTEFCQILRIMSDALIDLDPA